MEGHRFEVGAAVVRIIQDQDAESPLDRGDKNVIFASLERNTILRPDWAKEPSDLAEHARENKMWELPLFKYEHGLVLYKVSDAGNPFHCPWDSGRVGSILLAKREWRLRKSALKYAQAFVQEVTDWCNGNCWGFVVDLPDEKNADSCWGFIGDADAEWIVSEATQSAKYHLTQYNARLASQQEEARPDLYGNTSLRASA